jgi:hypothetical protein
MKFWFIFYQEPEAQCNTFYVGGKYINREYNIGEYNMFVILFHLLFIWRVGRVAQSV